jgi:5-methylcytosine-specific restriction endonuclease McrA
MTAAEFYAPQPRAIARAAGLRYFFPGVPCRADHVGWWWVRGGCVECGNERKRQWVKANPERAKAYGRAHYEANATDYKARARRWKADNPDKAKVRKTKPDPVKRRAAERRRRRADPEKYRIRARSRKAQRRGAEGSYTVEDVNWLRRKQRGVCAYCPARLVPGNEEVDHIQAVVRGGSNHRRNLQLLCVPCNRSKGARDPIDFARKKGLLL